VQRDDYGFLPEHYGYRRGHATGSLELEVASRMSDLLSHAWSCLVDHGGAFSGRFSSKSETKKADVAEHPKIFRHVGLLLNEPPDKGRAALHLVIRLTYIFILGKPAIKTRNNRRESWTNLVSRVFQAATIAHYGAFLFLDSLDQIFTVLDRIPQLLSDLCLYFS